MSAPDLSILPTPDRQAEFERWRRRSRLMRRLRIVLPALIGLILAALAATIAFNSFRAGPSQPKNSDDPIRLVNPRFVGRDDRGRAFVLTAVSATRDPSKYQRVLLDRPALVLDEEGPDPMRITAHQGVYNEITRQLDVSGGVRVSGSKIGLETASSTFDTKTGELVGSGPVQGSGPMGEIEAKSYAVTNKGSQIEFHGGVHTRLDMK